MKIKFLAVLPLSITLMYSCSAAADVDEIQNEIGELTDDKISDDQPNGATIEGVYSNGDGGTLTISNLRDDDGQAIFDFHFISESANEDCAGIEYEGVANYDGDLSAVTIDADGEDRFSFNESLNSLNFEPDMGMIGMECARVLSTDFTKE